ncbi:hypothetical protein CSN31_003843 [Salmonella enterica subsp. diarizonae]|nr:hypothetical protein [Salmonella enterica subsp. diarizonae]
MNPVGNITLLINNLSKKENINHSQKQEIIPLVSEGHARCIIIHSGTFGVYRREERLLLRVIEGPEILGIASIFQHIGMEQYESLYLYTYTSIDYEFIDPLQFSRIVSERNLWEPAMLHFGHLLSEAVNSLKNYTGRDTKALVTRALLALSSHSEEFRRKIIASDYIKERTSLSRSVIMKILKQLRDEGKIEIEKGILIKTTL